MFGVSRSTWRRHVWRTLGGTEGREQRQRLRRSHTGHTASSGPSSVHYRLFFDILTRTTKWSGCPLFCTGRSRLSEQPQRCKANCAPASSSRNACDITRSREVDRGISVLFFQHISISAPSTLFSLLLRNDKAPFRQCLLTTSSFATLQHRPRYLTGCCPLEDRPQCRSWLLFNIAYQVFTTFFDSYFNWRHVSGGN